MDAKTIIQLLLVSSLLSAAAICCLRPFAIRWGWIDHPGHRKQHDTPTPVIGGIAMFLAFVGTAVFSNVPLRQELPLITATGILILVGAIDDRHPVKIHWRLVAQIIAALIMVYGAHLKITELGSLSGAAPVELNHFSTAFTVFAVVGLINAINMLDGVDGVAASITLVLLGELITFFTFANAPSDISILLIVGGSITGFLVYNFPREWRSNSKVFMGDAGSTFLGFILAWFSTKICQQPLSILKPVAVLWLLAIPVMDTLRLITQRALRRSSPFSADRQHLHHLCLRSGMSPKKTLAFMVSATLCTAIVGFFGTYYRWADTHMLAGFIAAFIMYTAALYRWENKLQNTGQF